MKECQDIQPDTFEAGHMEETTVWFVVHAPMLGVRNFGIDVEAVSRSNLLVPLARFALDEALVGTTLGIGRIVVLQGEAVCSRSGVVSEDLTLIVGRERVKLCLRTLPSQITALELFRV